MCIWCLIVNIFIEGNREYTAKPVLRGHLWDKEKVDFQDRWPLKRGSIYMKFYMTGQEKGDILIQVIS